MIAGIFHQGSGCGNQLHRYVATRVLAFDKGYDFGMIYNPDGSGKQEGFKGESFMNIDKGKWFKEILPPLSMETWTENTNYYNPEFNFVEDNTIIDGEFQDERYFSHRMKEIDEWLKVEPTDIPDDVCVIGFRGGEYSIFPDLFLTPNYWREAMAIMEIEHGIKKYEVHTDDALLATEFFSKHGFNDREYKVIHDISINWRAMRYAKHAIIANSSFYILPRLLQHYKNKDALTIAPRGWARHNIKVWSMPQNYYSKFTYI